VRYPSPGVRGAFSRERRWKIDEVKEAVAAEEWWAGRDGDYARCQEAGEKRRGRRDGPGRYGDRPRRRRSVSPHLRVGMKGRAIALSGPGISNGRLPGPDRISAGAPNYRRAPPSGFARLAH
jgi:hypothetical protein